MRKGIVVAIALFGLTALTWALSSPSAPIPVSGRVSQLLGGLALTGFAQVFILATRAQVLDSLFAGLDKAYRVHKWLGITSVSFVVVHLLTHGGTHGARGGLNPPGESGDLALLRKEVLSHV